MKRREVIKGLGLSFGALLVAPSALSLLQSCANETGPIWEPVFFDKSQVQLLNKITDIILPKTEDSPGATEVNVPQFIDRYAGEVIEVEEQEILKKGFTNFGKLLLDTSKAEQLDDLKSEDIEPVLAKILKKTKEEDEVIMRRFYTAIENKKAPTDEDANYVVLGNIRNLCVFAYTNSEKVGEEIMAYAPVPGKQEGCIDISETGGKAYSL